MNIRDALWVLERAHTRDDAQVGYRVETLPQVFEHSRAEYIEAWGVVRDHLRHGDGTCNICGGPLHVGCCNPDRPAGVPVGSPSDHLPPIALTDQHVAALERAIRAESYDIFIDSDGNITLEKRDEFDERIDLRERLVCRAKELGCNELEIIITGGDIFRLQALIAAKEGKSL